MSMLDKVNSAIEIKGDIADAIEAKGVSMTGVTFGGYATKIGEISGGIDPTSANAGQADVRLGKTFFSVAGGTTMVAGLMPDSTVTSAGGATTVTSGYLANGVTVTGGSEYSNVAKGWASPSGLPEIPAPGYDPAVTQISVTQGTWTPTEDFPLYGFDFSGTSATIGQVTYYAIIEGGSVTFSQNWVCDLYVANATVTTGRDNNCFHVDISTNGVATFNGSAKDVSIGTTGTATFNQWADYIYNQGTANIASNCEATEVCNAGVMTLRDTANLVFGRVVAGGSLTVGAYATATIYADPDASIVTGGGTITYLVDTTDTDATASNVLDGKTFYSANNRFASTGSMPTSTVTETSAQAVITSGYLASGVTITKGGSGMPSIPASFTDLSLNTSYTASGDGWIKYKISYYWGAGQNATLTIGSRTYQITASGEDLDVGWIEMEGIAPVFSGEAFQLTTTGSASSHAYLKAAYL